MYKVKAYHHIQACNYTITINNFYVDIFIYFCHRRVTTPHDLIIYFIPSCGAQLRPYKDFHSLQTYFLSQEQHILHAKPYKLLFLNHHLKRKFTINFRQSWLINVTSCCLVRFKISSKYVVSLRMGIEWYLFEFINIAI